jgi:hypothetical protein
MKHQPDYQIVDRNRFFTGKFLTERDFNQEQAYFLARSSVHNRLLHDWGIVCGLEVNRLASDSDPCYRRVVKVTAGMALDCCGRPVILSETEHCVDLPTLPKEVADPCGGTHAKEAKEPAAKEAKNGVASGDTYPPARTFAFFLCVQHKEKRCEKMPVLFDDECNAGVREEYNRLHEYPVFCWRECTKADLDHVECWPEIWGLPDLRPNNPACPSFDPVRNYNLAPSLAPACECGPGVPLALVFPVWDDEGNWTGFRLSPAPTPHKLTRLWGPDQLTHIVDTNWHPLVAEKNEIKAEDFEQLESLEIYFDRPLAHQPDEKEGGVNRFTFQVQYTDPCNPARLNLLQPAGGIGLCPRPHSDAPQGLPNMGARFAFNADDLTDLLSEGRNTANKTQWIDFFITLRCDLILDINGRAVDGNYLGGQFPTGDGVPGGSFETWFRVNLCKPEPDEESHGEEKQKQGDKHPAEETPAATA